MNKLYISKKYYKYIHNIRQINNSYDFYYEIIIKKDLCDDIIRESNPNKCIDCGLNYNMYYKKLCIYYKYLTESKLNSSIILKIKNKLKKIDNILEEEFITGNRMIFYDHICTNCINDINKNKIITSNYY